MSNKNVLIIGVIVLLVASGSFYGGAIYQKKKTETQREQRGNFRQVQGGRQGGGQRMPGMGLNSGSENGDFAVGEIIGKDEKSITIKTPGGGSKIIFFSDSTSIGKSAEGSVSDLETGKQVMISGTVGSDGSLSAKNIQVR